jgi:hypothetical protein
VVLGTLGWRNEAGRHDGNARLGGHGEHWFSACSVVRPLSAAAKMMVSLAAAAAMVFRNHSSAAVPLGGDRERRSAGGSVAEQVG